MSRQVRVVSDHSGEAPPHNGGDDPAEDSDPTEDSSHTDNQDAAGARHPIDPQTSESPTASHPSGSSYPLWVRWTALIIFVIVLGTTFVFLGRWQLNRLHERRANNSVIRTNVGASVAPLHTVSDQPITQAQEYKRFQVTGTFQASKQLIIRYRDNGGAKGYEVVTPLRTTHGKSVLIDRGFVPTPGKGDIPSSVAPPPSGKVTVVGRARPSESGKRGATVPVDGHARLVNSDKIGKWLGHPVVDGYLDAVSMQPSDTKNFDHIKLPELSDGPHFWYAVQWFMFTGIGITGVVVFIRGDIRERRAAEGQTPQPGSEGAAGGSQQAVEPVGNIGQAPDAPAGATSGSPGQRRAAGAGSTSATDSAPSSTVEQSPRPPVDDSAEHFDAPQPAHRPSRRLRRTKPQRPVRYGDTQAPPGWKPPDSE